MKQLEIKRKLKFGIELEVKTRLSKSDLVNVVRSAGVTVRTPNGVHSVLEKAWKVVYDGSVSGGWEIVSPPLTSFDEVEKVCKALNENEVEVDKGCGFHVHHEIKDLSIKSIKNVYEIYYKYEDYVLDKYVPVSRRTGSESSIKWCRPMKNVILDVRECNTIEDMYNHRNIGDGRNHRSYPDCRYKKVNFRSFVSYGTLEFRQHSGTIDFEKIKHWVLITHMMIETAIAKKVIRSVSESRLKKWKRESRHSSFDFYKELGITDTELSKFWGKRKKALSNL